MTAPSDPRLLALHGLRLKGLADATAAAEAVSMDEADLKPLLDEMVAEGLATYRTGRLPGFALSRAGREAHAELVARELDATATRPAVEGAYRRFLELNGDLLEICTAWQLREVAGEPVVNDHTDAAHDAGVIARLVGLHEGAKPILSDLGRTLQRFSGYGPRLAHAVERVEAGDTDWFTKPMLASYHTVWFELHEDLLSTLGIERSAEGAG